MNKKRSIIASATRKKNLIALSACLCFIAEASALSFGSPNTSSKRGDSLKAEIEIFNLTEEEQLDLKFSTGSLQIYKALNIEQPRSNGEPLDLTIDLHLTEKGKQILRITSAMPLTSDYIDVVIEVTWKTGRLLRDIGISIDAEDTPAFITMPLLPIEDVNEKIVSTSGDTASELAMRYIKKDISLDQMLLALLRGNPAAFINNNVNLLKTDALLIMPSSEQSLSVSKSVAHEIIYKQNTIFDNYRAELARRATADTIAKPSNEHSERLSTHIAKSSKISPKNSLTLTTPKTSGITLDNQARELAKQAEEISRNITALHKITSELKSTESAIGITAMSTSSSVNTNEISIMKFKNFIFAAISILLILIGLRISSRRKKSY